MLVLGARLAFNSTFHSHDYISATAKIVQVDIESRAIGRYFPVALGLQADATETARALLADVRACGLGSGGWADWLDRFQADWAVLQAERAAEARNDAVPCIRTARWPKFVTPCPRTPSSRWTQAMPACSRRPARPLPDTRADHAARFRPCRVRLCRGARRQGGWLRNVRSSRSWAMVDLVSPWPRSPLPWDTTCRSSRWSLDNGAWVRRKPIRTSSLAVGCLAPTSSVRPMIQVARLCGALGFAVEAPGDLGPALREALVSRQPAVIHVKIDPTALSTLRKDLFTSSSKGTGADA